MSAVNVFLYTDCAVVMTDGRTTTPQGDIGPPRQKCAVLAPIGAIVAFRGPPLFLSSLVEVINSRHRTFDAAATNLGRDLREIHATSMARVPEHASAAIWQAFLIGHSEVAGDWQAWLAVSDIEATDAGVLQPFEPFACGTIIAPHEGTADAETQAIARIARTDPARFNPETHGAALMRGQARAYPNGVGEFCQITVATADGITTRILERWPGHIEAGAGLTL